jgi:hypothetical protein
MSEQMVCNTCVGEEYLVQLISNSGIVATCYYCESDGNCIQLDELCEVVHEGVQEHFGLTSEQPSGFEQTMLSDRESEYSWERDGQEILYLLQDIMKIDDCLAKDINEFLSNTYDNYEEIMCGGLEFYGDAHYKEKASESYVAQQSWVTLCSELKHRSRFFSPLSESILNEFFSNLHNFKTFDGESIVKDISPGSDDNFLYRVRTVYSQYDVEKILKSPVEELGSPPNHLASSGRMNPVGISVFYGALDPSTCVSEVRPTVGSYIVLGKFKVLKKLKVIDLDLLPKLVVKGSYFNPDSAEQWGKAEFLRQIVKELTKPIMPGDEPLEYLPTQAIAEYFAEKIKPKLDGIIFQSSQVSSEGKNIVLFNHASLVKPYDISDKTEITVSFGWQSDDDYDDSITIHENRLEQSTDTPSATLRESSTFNFDSCLHYSEPNILKMENREYTLSLQVDDIEVKEIKGVAYECNPRTTSRHITSIR